jgi:hypothetical protein
MLKNYFLIKEYQMSKYLYISLLAVLLHASSIYASCGITDDLVIGNIASKNIFSRFVKKETLITASTLQMPADYVPAESYNATGNDLSDDTLQLQSALNQNKKIWLAHNGVYRISTKLRMPANSAIMSDGTATILMLGGTSGFTNSVGQRSNSAIYGDKGTGIEISGNGAILQDVSIVKEYQDNRYVIAILVINANNVVINKLAIRGFSIAPGIITLSSAPNTVISNSVIHNSCTKTTTVPADLPALQITGILIDDGRYNDVTSDHSRITNNVIVDLFMSGSNRGDQTDGITYAGAGIGNGIVISNNYIDGVAEGLDLFGSNIQVLENSVSAREQSIKLIHQANNILIENNYVAGKPRYGAIHIWNAEPNESTRPNAITIRKNLIDTRNIAAPGIKVEPYNGYSSPYNIYVSENVFAVNACVNEAVACDSRQCSNLNNDKFLEGVLSCP